MKALRKWVVNRKSHLVVLQLCLGLWLLYTAGIFTSVSHIFGKDRLHKSNKEYLDTSKKEVVETFVVLSGLKTELSILESTSGGIDFIVEAKVQVGKIVTPLNAIIDHAWKSSLLGMISLESLSLVLDFSAPSFAPCAHLFFFLSAVYSVFGIFLASVARVMKTGLTAVFFVISIIHIVIPGAVFGASLLSKAATKDLATSVHNGFVKHRNDVRTHNKAKGIHDKIKERLGHTQNVHNSLEDRLRLMVDIVIKHIVIILLNNFVFPLIMVYSIFFVIKKSLLFIIKPDYSKVMKAPNGV